MARNSSRAFRKTATQVVARDGQICGICHHPGAITADHIISYKDWPKDHQGQPLPGLDHPDNLQAAHGSRGTAEHNPCYQCTPKGRYCNQSRGGQSNRQQPLQEPHSRPW